jgi:hypothetical protein
MSQQAQTLSIDCGQALAAVDELRSLFEQSPQWLQWLASEAFQGFHEGVDLLRVDNKFVPAGSAGDLRVGAQLGDKLVLLLAALRAGNGQAGAWVDREFHGGPCEK